MKITVFSTTPCTACANLKTWLNAKKIEFVERNKLDDPEVETIVMGQGFMSYPVVHVDGVYVHGAVISNVAKLFDEKGIVNGHTTS